MHATCQVNGNRTLSGVAGALFDCVSLRSESFRNAVEEAYDISCVHAIFTRYASTVRRMRMVIQKAAVIETR